MAEWVDDFDRLLEQMKGEGEIERVTIEAAENMATLIDFADWVASEVCQEDFEDNAGAFAEVACRKLHKLGIVKKDGDNWVYGEDEDD